MEKCRRFSIVSVGKKGRQNSIEPESPLQLLHYDRRAAESQLRPPYWWEEKYINQPHIYADRQAAESNDSGSISLIVCSRSYIWTYAYVQKYENAHFWLVARVSGSSLLVALTLPQPTLLAIISKELESNDPSSYAYIDYYTKLFVPFTSVQSIKLFDPLLLSRAPSFLFKVQSILWVSFSQRRDSLSSQSLAAAKALFSIAERWSKKAYLTVLLMGFQTSIYSIITKTILLVQLTIATAHPSLCLLEEEAARYIKPQADFISGLSSNSGD